MGRTSRPTFVTRDSRTVRSSRDAVLAQLLQPQRWPDWQPEIVSTEGPDEVHQGAVVTGHARMLGFHVEGRSTIELIDAETMEEDVVVGVRMRVRYELRDTPDGVVVTRTLTSRLPGGPLGRVLASLLAWRLRKMQHDVLERLAAQAEAEPS